uniref:Uncharacterized protein n=1 Tax=Aegilops tauschii subsp. strangulata TaxID=200361 RepID=A0A453GJN0_AEGTS
MLLISVFKQIMRRKLFIRHLKDGVSVASSHDEIKNILYNHFNAPCKTPMLRQYTMGLDFTGTNNIYLFMRIRNTVGRRQNRLA